MDTLALFSLFSIEVIHHAEKSRGFKTSWLSWFVRVLSIDLDEERGGSLFEVGWVSGPYIDVLWWRLWRDMWRSTAP